jgi:isopentenyl-diphosphate delta-isomerase
MMKENVILVDELDRERGVMEKLEAHRRGELHRALSVIIFNSAGEMLLQKRAAGKYHSGGLLTNACCSHPRPGEEVEAAAGRRLKEEMGITASLRKKGTFIYRSEFPHGLTEHEFDHVFEGVTDQAPDPDPREAETFCYLSTDEIKKRIAAVPGEFTTWFRIVMDKFY